MVSTEPFTPVPGRICIAITLSVDAMNTIKKAILITSVLGVFTLAVAAEKLNLSDFGSGSLSGWESKSFKGETSYTIVVENGVSALRAQSNGTASGLGKKVKIDLEKTPYLNWSWKVDGLLTGIDEQSKSGDDYVARLYVVKSGGALIWKTRALNYVWSSNQKKEASWPNAYQPKNASMLAVRGVSDQTGEWMYEKRNVKEDLQRAFGKNFKRVDAIALMTDTDNSGRSASALYGDIFFSAE